MNSRRRLKVAIACEICRRRKIKCDGIRPVCGNCAKRPSYQAKCIYTPALSRSIGRSAGSSEGSPVQQVDQPPQQRRSPPYKHLDNSSSSAFNKHVEAAIESRSVDRPETPLKLPQNSTAIPMVDSSLFPSLQDDTIIGGAAVGQDGLDYELPPRKQADSMINAYWSLVHPLFPVLQRPQFVKSYNALFSGTALPEHTDERTLVSTLNAVFALSIQLQESLDPRQRERLSGKYFQRAHALLHAPVWEAASLEVVQCLLIMSQYLQCTKKPHQTWMVVGLVVRIAQGLGLHESHASDKDAALKRRVWVSCIIMDRMTCILHGRPAAIPGDLSFTAIQSLRHQHPALDENDLFVTMAVELSEISHSAAQGYFSSSSLSSWSSSTQSWDVDKGATPKLIEPSPTEHRMALSLQVDGALTRWRHSLPPKLRYSSPEQLADDDVSSRQATVLHLRFLHLRMLLFRPTLARCCLATSETEPTLVDGPLTNKLLQQCASECVASAQQTLSAVYDHYHIYSNRNLLPAWWYRVFYTHAAAMVLAVSTLRTDLFPRSATASDWQRALDLLADHLAMSRSVGVCRDGLERLFTRIEETQNQQEEQNLPMDDQNTIIGGHLDLWQDFGGQLDDLSLFNLDDTSWLI